MTNDMERPWSKVLADRIRRDGANYVHIEIRDETSGVLDSFNLDTADALEALTSPPAPSGWQQRIAAIDPWLNDGKGGRACKFCGAATWHKDECVWRQAKFADPAGQNTKDALPPVSEASPAVIGKDGQPLQDHEVDAFLASQPPSDPERVARIRRKLEDKLKEARAITESDPSPAKDPIADAVHADLAPLADALIAEGHKLAKEKK